MREFQYKGYHSREKDVFDDLVYSTSQINAIISSIMDAVAHFENAGKSGEHNEYTKLSQKDREIKLGETLTKQVEHLIELTSFTLNMGSFCEYKQDKQCKDCLLYQVGACFGHRDKTMRHKFNTLIGRSSNIELAHKYLHQIYGATRSLQNTMGDLIGHSHPQALRELIQFIEEKWYKAIQNPIYAYMGVIARVYHQAERELVDEK